MDLLNNKIKSRARLRFNNGTFIATKEIKSSLGQRRIIITSLFNVLKHKVSLLKFKEGILFTTLILVFDKSHIVHIKLPSTSTLLKLALGVSKSVRYPGYFMSLKEHKVSYPYMITPYMLFEIVKYKYDRIIYNGHRKITLISYFKKHVDSLHTNGISIYLC